MPRRTGAERARARLLPLLAAGTLVCAVGLAQAQKPDREQPVYLEADTGTFDNAKKTAVFTGNVVLTQGTLTIRADRMVVTQDADGFQHGVAYGNPASFRQKREGTDEWIEGWAKRMEYNSRTETLELFEDARMRRGQDEVRGSYISYNAQTELFRVLGSGKEENARGGSSGRVRAVIQPKNREGADRASPSGGSGSGRSR
ncbi:lipopolysaccharide transport periplasmic protein LptA [Pelomicrobium methylotrophicum]|uniref:Lipopolysaccharide export system protein LptA n=1 Tax=Pelomicrobium methylotrophicum TaxID=2602750 RepID=A0A5C7EK16_9PROT|nr:lipopolysaccharide transport periplasmic protein LptA [Pelomicrobium methylotrophicum]TXF12868.1 lipopolysaccharide transport periplasmic protein LptA [Pelomicrobium methylotrophicum]